MTQVPYTFGNETSPIPLSQLDANFAVVPAYANTAGNVVNPAQGNITSVGVLTSLSVAGSINAGNVTVSDYVSLTGNIAAGNLLTGGEISAYGNVSGGNITATGSIESAGAVSATGIVTGSNFNTVGAVSATGNITGGNLVTGGRISALGNVVAQGIISATGNIVTAQYFVGNFLGNITGNLSVGGSNTQVLFNQNGNVGAAGGLTYNSGSNVLTVLGTVSAQGNVLAGNVSVVGTVITNNAQFFGLVTAPTPITGAANNQVATTAFVNNRVGTLGTMATQNAISVAITGGTVSNVALPSATISSGTISGTVFSAGNISTANISNVNIVNANISTANISGLTTALAVADGGTGSSSLTFNAVLLGNGASVVQAVSPGTSGNLLTSNGTTWVSAALANQPTFGPGQSWQNVTSSRSTGVTYTNSTSQPIFVIAQVGAQTNGIYVYINGTLLVRHWYDVNGGAGQVGYSTAEFMVGPGDTYYVTNGPLRQWWEYRS